MVLVCHKHDFIFLKTRKTAGTSVEMALETLCVPPGQKITEYRPVQKSEYGIVGSRGDDYKLTGLNKLRRPWDWRNHQTASFVYRMIGKKFWDQCTKITSVRNPFDRMVSHYHYVTNYHGNTETDFDSIRAAFRNFCHSNRWSDDRRIVHLKDKFIIDHAVRFENMVDDLETIARKLDLPLETHALPVTKSMAKTRKKYDVPDYYDNDLIELVKKRMSWVFDHFDYPLEPQPKNTPA